MKTDINSEDVLALLEKLALTPGPSLNEEPRRQVIEEFLIQNHVASQRDAAGNVWVLFGRGRWSDTVVFDAHMDVVQEGFSPELTSREGCLFGLGLADNLAAVTLLAFLAVHMEKDAASYQRPLAILFSVGEEGDGNLAGVKQAVRDHAEAPHAFVAFDLSFDAYSISGLGSLRYNVSVTCPGGHSWADYGIPSAIDQVMDFLRYLKDRASELETRSPGHLSFNIGSISGGEGINSIARSAGARFEFRATDPDLLKHMNRVVEEKIGALNDLEGVEATCPFTGRRPAAPPVHPERLEPHVVQVLRGLGENPRPVVRSTNINASLAAGWPSICLGLCQGGRYHSPEEYLVIDSLAKGWKALCLLAGRLLNT